MAKAIVETKAQEIETPNNEASEQTEDMFLFSPEQLALGSLDTNVFTAKTPCGKLIYKTRTDKQAPFVGVLIGYESTNGSLGVLHWSSNKNVEHWKKVMTNVIKIAGRINVVLEPKNLHVLRVKKVKTLPENAIEGNNFLNQPTPPLHRTLIDLYNETQKPISTKKKERLEKRLTNRIDALAKKARKNDYAEFDAIDAILDAETEHLKTMESRQESLDSPDKILSFAINKQMKLVSYIEMLSAMRQNAVSSPKEETKDEKAETTEIKQEKPKSQPKLKSKPIEYKSKKMAIEMAFEKGLTEKDVIKTKSNKWTVKL